MMNLWFIFHCRIYNHHLLKYCFRNVFNKCLSLEFFYGSIKAVPNKLCVQLYNFHNFMIRILWPWGLKWRRKWLNTTLWQYENHAFPLDSLWLLDRHGMLKPMSKTPFIKKGSKSNNVNSKMRKKKSVTQKQVLQNLMSMTVSSKVEH